MLMTQCKKTMICTIAALFLSAMLVPAAIAASTQNLTVAPVQTDTVRFLEKPTPNNGGDVAYFKVLRQQNNTALTHLATLAERTGQRDVGLMKSVLQNSPLGLFNTALFVQSPKVYRVVNDTLAYYQRRLTNLLLMALLNQNNLTNTQRHQVTCAANDFTRKKNAIGALTQWKTVPWENVKPPSIDTSMPVATHSATYTIDPVTRYHFLGWVPINAKINPEKLSRRLATLKPLVFFDGDDPRQILFVDSLLLHTRHAPILLATCGNLRSLSKHFNRPVFLLQKKLVRFLNLHHVPALVSVNKAKRRIVIHLFAITDNDTKSAIDTNGSPALSEKAFNALLKQADQIFTPLQRDPKAMLGHWQRATQGVDHD